MNKLERDNADYEGLMETLHNRYGRKVVGVQIPIGHQAAFSGVLDVLSMKVYKGKDRGEEVEDIPSGYHLEAGQRREKMMDAAAEGDDDLAIKYLDGQELSEDEIEHGLLVGIETGRVVPVMLGSAMSGIGVATLLDRICTEMPSPIDAPKDINGLSIHHVESGEAINPDPAKGLISLCFKTTADPFVGKINFLRVYSGKLNSDDSVSNVTRETTERMHNIFFAHGKTQEPTSVVIAGDICAVAKLADTHTGDTLTSLGEPTMLGKMDVPEPIFRRAIVPKTKSDEDKLPAAIAKLIEEDPTLRFTNDAVSHQIVMEGMGDIHVETVIEKLKSKFGVEVGTEDAKVAFRETIRGTAKAQGRFKRQSGGKGQFGDCWIEITPLGRGEGFVFESKVVGGAIPKNYIPAIEKGILEEMERGPIGGFPLTDFKVVVLDGSYHEVDSSEMAFKQAGALALREALVHANPMVLEPIALVQVEVGDEHVGDVVSDLSGRRGVLQGVEFETAEKRVVRALVPTAMMQTYALSLRSLTKGRGRFRQEFSHYEEGPAPTASPV